MSSQRDPTTWVRDSATQRRIDRIQPDMAGAAAMINDAVSTVKAARKISPDAVSFAISGCWDAARKSVTAHMIANGLRPASGPGGHKLVVEYAEIVLAEHFAGPDIDALDNLRRARHDSEYGHIPLEAWNQKRLDAACDFAERIIGVIRRILVAKPKPPQSP